MSSRSWKWSLAVGLSVLVACGGDDSDSTQAPSESSGATPDASRSVEDAANGSPVDGSVEILDAATEASEACVKTTCAEFASMYFKAESRQLCGQTPDSCGGTQSCAAVCSYGTCTDHLFLADVCSCTRYTAGDALCQALSKPPSAVICGSGAVAPKAGCVTNGSSGAFCCP